MREEAELIRRSAAGDLGAFEDLVVLKRGLVYRTAHQVLRNEEDARDVAQLVFVRLWKVIRRYRAERKFDTWLYRITVNLAIDRRRRLARAGVEVPMEAAATGRAAEGSRRGGDLALVSRETPADRLDRMEMRRIYESVAGELTDRQRTIFALREIEGLSAKEIAKALGVTSSTVRNTLLQARTVLRGALRRRFPEYFPSSGGRRD
jgi:RNA polymerase sigma-70 factor (ECF subfamily)